MQCVTRELHWFSLSSWHDSSCLTVPLVLTALIITAIMPENSCVLVCACLRDMSKWPPEWKWSWWTTFDFIANSLPVSQINWHFLFGNTHCKIMCVDCAEEDWFRLLFMLTYHIINGLFARIVEKNTISVHNSKMKIVEFRNMHIICCLMNILKTDIVSTNTDFLYAAIQRKSLKTSRLCDWHYKIQIWKIMLHSLFCASLCQTMKNA